LKQRSKLKTQRKGRKKTPSDEPTVPSVQASEHLVHYAEAEMKLTPSDEPMVHFLVASETCRGRVAKTVAPDDSTV
jgi:hypothetical protein